MVDSSQHQARKLRFIAAKSPWQLTQATPAEPNEFLHVAASDLKHYRQYLGREFSAVSIDCSQSLHADAIVALSGCVRAGGELILRLPEHATPALIRFRDDAARFFSAASLTQVPQLLIVEPIPFVLTAEQHAALQSLQAAVTDESTAIVIQAPRGRGKSTLLGLWMAATHTPTQFILCAPSRKQASSVFRHLSRDATQAVKFVSPDQLLDHPAPMSAWLVIDEAASIPAHVLQQASQRFKRIVFASTTEGYESAGRGFVLRFLKQLPHLFAKVRHITLKQPVRWGENDPLEQWINHTFCLYAPAVLKPFEQPIGNDLSVCHTKYRHAHAAELTHQQLDDVFQLLMAAHYQTSPNDLKILLDDPKQSLILQYEGATDSRGRLVGVCWLCSEGPVEQELHTPILAGTRRPAGALLPQLIAYALRIPEALKQPTIRIVRIAVRDSVRNLGLGSQLLKQVVHYYPDHLRGTSFGYSPELHKFWHANHYQPIRLGTHIDAASGLPSAVYIERTSIRNPQLAAQLHTAHCVLLLTLPFMPVMRFMQKTLQQCSDEFDLAASTDQINTADRQAATQAMQTSYQAFANGIIPYDFVHAIIAYGLHNGLFRGEAEDIAFVNQVNGYQDLAKAALALNFDGKKQLEQHLRTVCGRLHLEL